MSSDVAAQRAYRARPLKVVAYIDANLDADLALDTLAGVASASTFHFHRQFAALFGTSIFEVVQLLRLKRASGELAFRNRSVIAVALDARYESPRPSHVPSRTGLLRRLSMRRRDSRMKTEMASSLFPSFDSLRT